MSVGAGLALPAVGYLRGAPPPVAPEMRLDISTPVAGGDPLSFALSPDGQQIVFVAAGEGAPRLWLLSPGATTAQPLAGTDGAAAPFWSPDSRSVAFFANGQVQRLDLGGGAPRILAAAATARGGTWNADGVLMFTSSSSGPLSRVADTGGAAVPVTTLDRQSSHRWPVFLPDGRHFLFYAQGGPDTGGIFLGALNAGAPTSLTARRHRGYVPARRAWACRHVWRTRVAAVGSRRHARGPAAGRDPAGAYWRPGDGGQRRDVQRDVQPKRGVGLGDWPRGLPPVQPAGAN